MVAKPKRRWRECPRLHRLGQDEPDGQGLALADKRVQPLLQGDGRDAVVDAVEISYSRYFSARRLRIAPSERVFRLSF